MTGCAFSRCQIVFMDNSTYEETRMKRDDSWAKWIREGDTISLISWNGIVITVDVPKTVTLIVSQTDPGVKGNTASGGSKPATLETGAVIQVFKIAHSYVTRAS